MQILTLPPQIFLEGQKLVISGNLTLSEFLTALKVLKSVTDHTNYYLADLINYGAGRFNESDMAEVIEQLEFDTPTFNKIAKISTVDPNLRNQLTSEHIYVLSHFPKEHHEKWAKLCVENTLTAHELKLSIACGEIIRTQKKQKKVSHKTGVFYFQRWMSITKPSIANLDKTEIQSILEDLKPVIEFANELKSKI